jgi:positive regulator of sigma E activity
MEETGTIIKLTGQGADVLLKRELSCGGCNHCHSSEDGTGMIAEVDLIHGLSIGDKVILESKQVKQVTAGFIIFILPLILFIIGFLSGRLIPGNSEFSSFLWGLAFAVIPYTVIYFSRKMKEKKGNFDFVIKEILQKKKLP